MSFLSKSFSDVDWVFYWNIFAKFIASAALAIPSSYMIGLFLSEIFQLNPAETGSAQVLFFPIAFIVATLLFASGKLDDAPYDQVIEMRKQLRMAESSKRVISAVLIALSLSSIYFAAQAISFLTNDLQETSHLRDLRGQKAEIENIILQTQKKFADTYISQTEEAIRSFDAKISTLTASAIRISDEIKAADAAALVSNRDGEVSQLFLFQFFTTLVVRLGTLAVLLILFGVALRQYRRYDRQILELRQVHLAISLLKSKVNVSDLKIVRDAVSVDDDARIGETNRVDTAFMSGFTSSLSAFADKASDVVAGKAKASKE